jgi:hypothetical protein
VKIQNGAGDGAGRSRYLLREPDKVLAVSSNIPSPTLISGDYKTLADDFNRTLLARQGDYRTDHFVVSFQHRFTQEELEKIIEIIEAEFQKEFGEDRPYLIVVHAEEFKGKTPEEILEERIGGRAVSSKPPIPGTSFHIVMGRNTEGKGIRLEKKEYLAFKRKLAKKLQPFANEREREVFQHFLEGKRERSYYKKGELYKPEKNEKVWGKKILRDITSALEKGEVEKAVEILNQHNAEIETFEIAPYNKQKLKEPTPYIILPRIGKDGMFAMRLKKAERVLYERYKTVFEELRNESQRISQRAGEYLDQNRRAESDKERVREIYSELAKVREIGEELGRITAELSEELGLTPEELKRLAREDREQNRRAERHRGTERGIEERNKRVKEVSGELVHGVNGVISGISNKHFDSGAERRREDGSGIVERDKTGVGKNRERDKRVERVKRGSRKVGKGSMEKGGFGYNLGSGGNKTELDTNRDRNLDSCLSSQFLLTTVNQTYLIGKIPNGKEINNPVYRAVISDNEEVLKKLGAIEIKQISNERGIIEYWEKEKCRGYVEIYTNSEKLPDEWIVKGLEKAVWKETYKPVWSTIERTEEIKPTEVHRKKYFEIDGKVVLDKEIEKEPHKYLECENHKVREIAEKRVKELERIKRMEREIRRRRERSSSWDLSR